MATNPFQRFARGAAAAAPSTAHVESASRPADSNPNARKREEPGDAPSASRKRKRAIKEEPDHAPTFVSPSSEASEATVEPPLAANDAVPNTRRLLLLEQLVEARRDGPDAAIDRYGTQACVFQPATTSKTVQRFQILVAALLSSQTQDPITYAAMQRLHTQLDGSGGDKTVSEGLTIAKVRSASVARLEALLVPVGFYRRKAQQLHQIAQTLARNYKSDIPRTLEGLLALPGVGPKIARVILLLAWDDVDAGLIVDTHVHRLSQRLGWVPPVKGSNSTAEHTRVALEEWVPRPYWRDFSRLVVGFGQNVCVAVHPKCIECPLAPQCPSAFAYQHSGKPKKKKPSVPLQYEHDTSEDAVQESA